MVSRVCVTAVPLNKNLYFRLKYFSYSARINDNCTQLAALLFSNM
jgi:hypothetical protein